MCGCRVSAGKGSQSRVAALESAHASRKCQAHALFPPVSPPVAPPLTPHPIPPRSGLDRESLQRALGVKPMDKSSRFRGVSKKKGKWEAKVMVNRRWAYRELFDR